MPDLVRFVNEPASGLAELVLARPEARNACTPALIENLLEVATAATAAAADGAIGALLIRAEGPDFCVGADLRHFAAASRPLADELAAMATPFHEAVTILATLPVPVVGAVQGNAVGAGLGLALVCDMLLLGENARLSTGYSRLGLSADAGVSFHLTRALGERRARELLITARTLSASDAVTMGLADRVCHCDTLEQDARGVAGKLAEGPTAAFAAIKRLTTAALHQSLDEQLRAEEREIVALAADATVADRMRALLR